MSYDKQGLSHNKARAVGQSVSGPYSDSRGMYVKKVTTQELSFGDEMSALRYMRNQSGPTTNVLVNSRRLKHIWKDDEM